MAYVPNAFKRWWRAMFAAEGSAAVAWGAITGTLGNQTDLNTALAAKGTGDILMMAPFSTVGDTVPLSSVEYFCPISVSGNAAENVRQVLIPTARTFRRLTVRTGSNVQPATGSLVVTLRINGVNTALVVTVPADAAVNTVVVDAVNSVSCAAGDLISWQAQNNATTSSAGICQISMDAL